jgi:hypothetical protein
MGVIVKIFLSIIAVFMILAGFEDFGITFIPGVVILVACWVPGLAKTIKL